MDLRRDHQQGNEDGTDICTVDRDPGQAAATRRRAMLEYRGEWFGAHFPFPGVAYGGQVAKGAPNWAFIWKKYDSSK